LYSGYKVWRLRLFSFCGYELALAVLALVFFGAYDTATLCFYQFIENSLLGVAYKRFALGIDGHSQYFSTGVKLLKKSLTLTNA